MSKEVQNLMRSRAAGDQPSDSPRDGVLELVQVQINTMAGLAKSEQQQVVARSILAVGDSEAGRYNAEVDRFMRTSIRDLLAHHRSRGALHPDVAVAAGLIFSMLNGLHVQWLQTEAPLDAVTAAVPDYLDLILRA